MTSLLANLDETIKTKNQEEEKEEPYYLALCEYYVNAKDKQQSWVYVKPDGSLNFFANKYFNIGTFRSNWEDGQCTNLLSLYEYIDKELKQNTSSYWRVLIDYFLNDRRDKTGNYELKAKRLFEKFKERYIHKFIAHTYNGDYLNSFLELYNFYKLVYNNDNKYITDNCSPVFKYYIMCENNKRTIIFLKGEKNLTLQYLDTSVLDEKNKDNIYILEDGEDGKFKKFNYYKNSTYINYDDLYNGDKIFALGLGRDADIINKSKNALIDLLIILSQTKRSIQNLFIINSVIENAGRKGMKFEKNDKQTIFGDTGDIIDDLKNVKLIYVKGNFNKLYYKKGTQYFPYNKWGEYLTHLGEEKKSDLWGLLENINEEIFENDKSVIEAKFTEQEQQLRFFKEINDTLIEDDYKNPIVKGFLDNFFEFNKKNKLYANDISFHRKYIEFSPENYVKNEYYLKDESIKLEIIFANEREWWYPYIRCGRDDDNRLKFPKTFYPIEKLKHYTRIPHGTLEIIVHIYIELINKNNENILSDIAIKSLSKLITDYHFYGNNLDSIFSSFYIINDLNEKLISVKGQNEKQKLIKILIDKLYLISGTINEAYLLSKLKNHVDDNNYTKKSDQSYIDELNQKIRYIIQKIEYITKNKNYITENKIFINGENPGFYLNLLTYLEGNLDTERKQKLEYKEQVEEELRKQEILKQKNINAQEVRIGAQEARETAEEERIRAQKVLETDAIEHKGSLSKLVYMQTQRETDAIKHEDNLLKMEHAHKEELVKMEHEHEKKLSKMKHAHKEELANEQNKTEKARLIQVQEQEIAKSKEEHEQQLEQMKSNHANNIEQMQQQQQQQQEAMEREAQKLEKNRLELEKADKLKTAEEGKFELALEKADKLKTAEEGNYELALTLTLT